ncbi:hypothetical protein Droror1_Dr00014999 [Drosera rotundifolia]
MCSRPNICFSWPNPHSAQSSPPGPRPPSFPFHSSGAAGSNLLTSGPTHQRPSPSTQPAQNPILFSLEPLRATLSTFILLQSHHHMLLSLNLSPLRSLMASHSPPLHALVIPSEDYHQSNTAAE